MFLKRCDVLNVKNEILADQSKFLRQALTTTNCRLSRRAVASCVARAIARADIGTFRQICSEGPRCGGPLNLTGLVLGCIEAKFCKKYAFESSRQDLHNALLWSVL